ncbi:Beta-1,4-galactosyltransferase 5,Beta-N-acetyl-D-glucosaminide beta-1,4-N-acetylglucosaminyl-transferase [Mytilus edulis]|uniref:Beta-1,4-galactosyltransferase n=1 Tax=Mytilus edulis TaxID=6550 RepID=A0A8S3SYE8_MYTED|nr:Beta-1,4-galactosyltransferase 5,Beta-N-acetyl-D-glucosaminide beta-1,4-N-acetylglucosaminyl-transferase [Mytilus edulis]
MNYLPAFAMLLSIAFFLNSLLYLKDDNRYKDVMKRYVVTDKYAEEKSLCSLHPENLHGYESLNRSVYNLKVLQSTYNFMDQGHYRPVTCIPRQKVAILIPYRDRDKGLLTLLNNVLPRIHRQQIEFGIYVVEQIGGELFNKGVLFNAAFKYAMAEYTYDCVVLHDVDIISEDDRNFFTCGYHPRHLAVKVEQFNYTIPYADFFGGISNMPPNIFEQINGFSNQYEDWGLEDDDLYRRLTVAHGLKIERPLANVSTCASVHHSRPHKHDKKGKLLDRCNIYINRPRGWAFDGLSTSQYIVEKTENKRLFKHILISLNTTKLRKDFVTRSRFEDYDSLPPVASWNGNTEMCYLALKLSNKKIDQSVEDLVQKSVNVPSHRRICIP